MTEDRVQRRNLLCDSDDATDIMRIDDEIVAHMLCNNVWMVDLVDGRDTDNTRSDGESGKWLLRRHVQSRTSQ